MKYLTSVSISALWALFIFTAQLAVGQIAQRHPELCGGTRQSIPQPYNLTALSTDSKTDLTIELGGRTAKILMPVVNDIQEVCPLDGGKLLIFGYTGAGYVMYLISGSTGTVLDSFIVQDPVVSPDQHWLAMRDWIIPQSDHPVTDQYLLYDLTKDAAGNRFLPGVAAEPALRYGRTMYPSTRNHIPFENHAVRPDQIHTFPGGSFYWAEDSKSVAFADRTDEGQKIVLVKVSEKDLITLVHDTSADEVCGVLSGATVAMPRYDAIEVQARFHAPDSTNCDKILTLHAQDFKPAKEEIFPPRVTTPSVRGK